MAGIPVLHVEGDCIAKAWENSLIELHRNGCRITTQYDKPEDPASIDATMVMVERIAREELTNTVIEEFTYRIEE